MDVHPPHDPVHTWRDFFTHLIIVTIGLFIALSLEGFVEYMHHRHLVREARENIHQELIDNHEAAQKDLAYIQQNIDRIKADIVTLHTLREDPKNFKGKSLTNTMEFSTFHDAAWRTARDTSALSFMPYAEVQRDSEIYALESEVNTSALEIGHREFLALAPTLMGDDPDKLPSSEVMNMMRDNASTEIELVTLKQYVQQLDESFVEELKK